MKKCLFFVIFCVALFVVGCSDPHENLEDFPEIIPDEPEIVTPDESIQDDASNSDDTSVELEVEEFEFDVSKLTPSRHGDSVVEDLTMLSVYPTVISSQEPKDVEITFGKEGIGVVEESGDILFFVGPYGGWNYEIEVCIDNVWYSIWDGVHAFIPAEYSSQFEKSFTFSAEVVALDKANRQTVPTGTVLSGLPVGRYRIVKDVDGWKYAEFVIE